MADFVRFQKLFLDFVFYWEPGFPNQMYPKTTIDTFLSLFTQNKNEKKLKREQASAQAMASRKQSFEIIKSLDENRIQVSNSVGA